MPDLGKKDRLAEKNSETSVGEIQCALFFLPVRFQPSLCRHVTALRQLAYELLHSNDIRSVSAVEVDKVSLRSSLVL
jgi:hypothetical protein